MPKETFFLIQRIFQSILLFYVSMSPIGSLTLGVWENSRVGGVESGKAMRKAKEK